MTFKSATQPFCRTCGKPIRKYTRRVWIEKEEKHRAPASSFSRYVVGVARTREDCARLSSMQVVSVTRAHDKEFILSFNEWDGESYADEFFCTSSCAAVMGYAACEKYNLSMPAWRNRK
jgi:hypothetical protein